MCNVKQKEVSCVSSMIESDVKCFNYMSDLCTMQYLMHIAIDACWCVWNRSKIYLPYFVLILSVKSKIELYFLIIEILIRKSSYVGDVLSQTINHPTHPNPSPLSDSGLGGGGCSLYRIYTFNIIFFYKIEQHPQTVITQINHFEKVHVVNYGSVFWMCKSQMLWYIDFLLLLCLMHLCLPGLAISFSSLKLLIMLYKY